MTTNQLGRWQNQAVEIIYLSTQGDFTKRKIKIWKIKDDSVYGYCYLRKEKRKFKAEQILAIHPFH